MRVIPHPAPEEALAPEEAGSRARPRPGPRVIPPPEDRPDGMTPGAPMAVTRVAEHPTSPSSSSPSSAGTTSSEPAPQQGVMAVTRVAEIAAAQSSSPPVPEALMGLIGVEDLAAAAIGVSKLRAGWGLRRRRYYAMNCPEGHGVYLVSSGPKGIEGRSTWKGACTECRRAETDDLIKELPTPDWLEMSKKESP